jgi:hypothetical protein
LHQTEAQKLELLKAGKSATEKHSLDAAACALVKCSDGVPMNDPLYANLRALQIEGNRYSAELQMLKNTGEFNYSRWSDKYGDWVTSQNEALRRIGGAGNLVMGSFGTVTGGMMAGAGAAACPVSLGAGCGVALLGTVIVGLSAEQAYDGNAAFWGPYASTEGARVIASFSTSTYPGKATPIRDAVIETGKFGSLAMGGKLIPKGISAIEEQIAKIKQTSTTVPANSARPQIVGDEPFSYNGLSDGGMTHPVSLPVAGANGAMASDALTVSRSVPRVDVTDEFLLKNGKNGSTTLQYGNPEGVHGLIVNVDKNGVLGFDIRSPQGGSSISNASGTDIFLSAMQRLEQEGINVNTIRGTWIEGTDSVNSAQYLVN